MSAQVNEVNAFTFSFSVLNWNVRGMGDSKKCSVIKDLVCDARCDILCFQETKCDQINVFKLREVCPPMYMQHQTLDVVGTRGGY